MPKKEPDPRIPGDRSLFDFVWIKQQFDSLHKEHALILSKLEDLHKEHLLILKKLDDSQARFDYEVGPIQNKTEGDKPC